MTGMTRRSRAPCTCGSPGTRQARAPQSHARNKTASSSHASGGIDILGTFTDNDTSAAGKRVRPGFEELMQLIESGTIRAVIAWNLDRLTRNWRDMIRIIEAGMEQELVIILVQGGDMDMATPNGRMMAGIHASIARGEIETKGARQKRANQQAAEAGKWVSGRRPFGYKRDGVTLIEAEALAIGQGYRALLCGGSLSEIARQWNAQGFTAQQTRKGEPSPWRQDSVRRVLRNPRYAGQRSYNGVITGPAVWPAIVPQDTWDQAQAILKDPSRRSANRGGPALLTGIALCGVCGAPVHRGGSGRGYPTYRCGATWAHFSHKAHPIEQYITALVLAWFAHPDAQARLARAEPADTGELLLRRATLESRVREAKAEFSGDGVVTPEDLRDILRTLRGQISGIDMQLAKAARSSLLVPLIGTADLREAWEGEMTLSQRRAVISALMAPRLLPPGKGARTFQPSSVDPGWKL